jgi:regulation of enolase protein 1 (concanavalin A-like superfamily)
VIAGPWLDESFAGATFDLRLRWHCPPERWHVGPGLTFATTAGSDFWQGTHYGFRVDNGHALLAEVDRDFVLETRVQVQPAHQYDQAGLMVRLSPEYWLKTSVEYEPGEPSRLGAVVTNCGWSDWSTQDIDPGHGPTGAGASYGYAGCTTIGVAQRVPASMPAAPRLRA